MRAFRVAPEGYVAGLDSTERLVLAHVVGDTAELLQSSAGAAAGAVAGWPDDPALRRLLPDASRDEPEVSEEFRRLTQEDLVGAKVTRLVAFADLLLDDPVARAAAGGVAPAPATDVPTDLTVDRAAARDIAAAMTDVRLVLAERLDVRSDEDSERLYAAVERGAAGDDVDDAAEEGGPRGFLGAVFVTLGWLQESLVTAMLGELRAR
ncbi:DUF2017 family protein [Luteimicrobium subarcticum]|uniref:Uncharacterized protein DUF2017 n=1 Tax=Luteimicrobium subarcticum TaxID=620910 RepID=A0A2M8WUA2_9MICO|nr:DUF2017 family protein [Luteimicrobium subarcticum]PJI94527.1 uncharacterized protein DUF2017 [Luteimicrobium subarcticum]